jgi:hypothetical protein
LIDGGLGDEGVTRALGEFCASLAIAAGVRGDWGVIDPGSQLEGTAFRVLEGRRARGLGETRSTRLVELWDGVEGGEVGIGGGRGGIGLLYTGDGIGVCIMLEPAFDIVLREDLEYGSAPLLVFECF